MLWQGFRPPSTWRQSGAEWSGCCPVDGSGKTVAWARPADDLLGCRLHGDNAGRLDGEQLRQHAAAVGVVLTGCGAPRPGFAPTAKGSLKGSGTRSKGDGGAAAGRLWSVSGAVPALGVGYLVDRGAWSAPGALPGAVRWVSAADYFASGAYPGIPRDAAGALVYRFAAPDDGAETTRAVQAEAVDPSGRRLTGWHCWDRDTQSWAVRDMKRPSLRGSDFNAGRRVFVGRWPAAPGEVWIVEGPIDALALTDHCRRHRTDAAVVAAPGTSGFKLAALEAAPADALVVVAADADGPGRAAAVRLGADLARSGRRWEARRAPAGDWCDWAVESAERMAVQDG